MPSSWRISKDQVNSKVITNKWRVWIGSMHMHDAPISTQTNKIIYLPYLVELAPIY